MPITLLNPGGLPEVDLYRQVSVARGSKLVFMAGQVAVDRHGELVGDGDFAAQVEQCYLNVATALAEAGASFEDVAKLTVYVVDWTEEKMPQFFEGVAGATARLGIETPMPPFTGVGVAALAGPGLMVEVEATAVLD